MSIKIKSTQEIEKIEKACQIAASVLTVAAGKIKPGLTALDLDKIAEDLIRAKGAEPVFKGYRGYRHATCISVNEEIVHGIPGDRVFQKGDIVSLDVGTKLDGYCGDTAATFPCLPEGIAVGQTDKKTSKLLRATKQALAAGIKQARPGNRLGDISAAIERVAKKHGYSVVRELYGHGIGQELHEDPLIPNFGNPGEGPELKPGMVLAIEPMLNVGTWKIVTLSDGWTVVTQDRSLSCHFEHTVAITKTGPKILTQRLS